MLRWAVELGRVDVLLETALMSTHLALPRRGYLEQLYHIFGYLKAHPKHNLFFDPQHPKVDEQAFKEYERRGCQATCHHRREDQCQHIVL